MEIPEVSSMTYTVTQYTLHSATHRGVHVSLVHVSLVHVSLVHVSLANIISSTTFLSAESVVVSLQSSLRAYNIYSQL